MIFNFIAITHEYISVDKKHVFWFKYDKERILDLALAVLHLLVSNFYGKRDVR